MNLDLLPFPHDVTRAALAICEQCGRLILEVSTHSGKKVALNLVPDDTPDPDEPTRFALSFDTGRILAARLDRFDRERGLIGNIVHSETCDGDEWLTPGELNRRRRVSEFHLAGKVALGRSAFFSQDRELDPGSPDDIDELSVGARARRLIHLTRGRVGYRACGPHKVSFDIPEACPECGWDPQDPEADPSRRADATAEEAS